MFFEEVFETDSNIGALAVQEQTPQERLRELLAEQARIRDEIRECRRLIKLQCRDAEFSANDCLRFLGFRVIEL